MHDQDNKTLFTIACIAVASIALFLFYDLKESIYTYALSHRLVQVLGIIFIGLAISVSSVLFQTITNNKILTPSILGFDSLYLMIQSIIIFIFGKTKPDFLTVNEYYITTVFIMIGFSFILYKLLFKSSVKNIYFILLAGIVSGTVFSSVSSFINRLIEPDKYMVFQIKAYANFDLIETHLMYVAALLTLICGYYIYKRISELDIYLIGSDNAHMLGINIDRLQIISLVIISILVSISTVLIGPITFLGLIVTNISYVLLNGYSHRYTLPCSIFLSWIVLSLGLIVIQRILMFDVNISMLINAVGGIYFIYLLIGGNNHAKN
jgi:iron complex transport system permease protein